MQTNKNNMKVQRSVSMYSHAFERACKRQIVTDPKSGNVSRIYSYENNVPSWLLSQWLCGNSSAWAHDARLHIARTNEPKSA